MLIENFKKLYAEFERVQQEIVTATDHEKVIRDLRTYTFNAIAKDEADQGKPVTIIASANLTHAGEGETSGAK